MDHAGRGVVKHHFQHRFADSLEREMKDRRAKCSERMKLEMERRAQLRREIAIELRRPL